MALIPVRGMLVHVNPPPDLSPLLTQFLVSCGLSRDRVDGKPINYPQRWAEATCDSVRKTAPDRQSQIKMKRSKLPVYWRFSCVDRPDWFTDSALVSVLLDHRTRAGADLTDQAHPERPGTVRAAFEALVGHRFDHEEGCRACDLARSGEGHELLEHLEVDSRAAWDLFKSFRAMFWLRDLSPWEAELWDPDDPTF